MGAMTLSEQHDSSGRFVGSYFTCVCDSFFGGPDKALGVETAHDGRVALWSSQGVWWTLQLLKHLERCTPAAGLWTWNWV